MARLTLLPPIKSKTTEAILQYINTNFTRIRDAFQTIGVSAHGTVTVTGSTEIDTGISTLQNGVVSLTGTPSSSAAFVTVTLVDHKTIRIQVFTDSFTLSTVPVEVNWYALGDAHG